MNIFHTLGYIWDIVLKKLGFTRASAYRGNDGHNDYDDTDKINFTAMFADKLKNLTLADSNINVSGTSNRATLLSNLMKDMRISLNKAVSNIYGYGGTVLLPYVQEGMLVCDIINQDNLRIDKIIGNKILDCVLMVDVKVDAANGQIYKRFIRYQLQGKTLTITNFAYKDSNEIDLLSVAEWANIVPMLTFQGFDRIPLAYIKSPKDNRKDKQIMGVPITYGCQKIMDDIQKTINEINTEFEYKRLRIFIDEQMIRRDERGKVILEQMFYATNGGGVSETQGIHEFSPAFRESSYYAHLKEQYALLERQVGTSQGILTVPTTRGATATEIKANIFDTYTIISDTRIMIEQGLDEFVEACSKLADAYSLGSYGDYELNIDWSYSMIENSTESFNQLTIAHDKGAVETAELRQFVRPAETFEESKKIVDDIKGETPPTAQELVGIA